MTVNSNTFVTGVSNLSARKDSSNNTVLVGPNSGYGISLNEFVPITEDYAGIMAAGNAAVAAGGGVVKLLPVTYNLGANTLPYYNNVVYQGSGYTVNPVTSIPTGGTILTGDGTAPAFYYVGSTANTPSTAQATLGDMTTPLLTQGAFTGGFLSGIGCKDMAFSGFTYAIKVGALYNPGMWFSNFSNLFAYNCGQWGFWFENFQMCNFDNLYFQNCANGGFIGASGTSLLNCGNSWFNGLFGQTTNVGFPRGWVIQARGQDAITVSYINDLTVNGIQCNGNSNTYAEHTLSYTSNTVNMNVPDLSKFAIDMPMAFYSFPPSGLGANQIYFVVAMSASTGAGTIQIANTINGTALNLPTVAAGTLGIYTNGFAPIEISGKTQSLGACQVTGSTINTVDAEIGGTALIVLQNFLSSYIGLNMTSVTDSHAVTVSDVLLAMRQCKAVVNNQFAIGNSYITADIDSTSSANSCIIGYGYNWRGGGLRGIYTKANSAVGIVSLSGSSDISQTALPSYQFLNAIHSTHTKISTSAQTLNPYNGNVVTLASGGTAPVLPNSALTVIGLFFVISNVSGGAVTMGTVGGTQNIIGAGASATTFSMANDTDYIFTARYDGTSYYWSVK